MDGFASPQPVGVIASRAGFNQRYVSEWLSVMVTGGIIELVKSEARENLFLLPGAHADFLTRRSGNANLGVYTQEIPLLTQCAMDRVVNGFTTGAGVALLLMARAFPQSRFIGMDIDTPSIEQANREAKRMAVSNVRFVVTDAAALADEMEFYERFDYVTAFDAIHDQTRPLAALKGIYHILTPGGFFSMIDIAAETDVQANMAHPMGPFYIR